jgi:tetratricopeptide (TPR) repeat protein
LVTPEKNKNFMIKKRLFLKIVFCLMILSFSVPVAGKGKSASVLQNQEASIPAEEKRKFDYFFLEALRQKMLGNRDAAADNLLRCSDIDPENAMVFYEMAKLNISLSRIPLAKKYMQEAVKSEPENFWMKQSLAQLYIQNREYALAAEVIEDILKNHPDRKEYNYALASLYAQMQQPQKAINALNDLEEETGINDQVSLEKFKLYLSMNKQKKAFEEIDRLIKAFPKDTRYRVLKGDLYMTLGNIKEAEKWYRAVLKEYPDDPLANNQLGLFYIQQNKPAEGVKMLTAVLENKEADYELKRGILSYISQDSILAEVVNDSIYLNVIKSYPEEEATYLIFATHLLDQNRKEGFEYIRKALEINPKYEDSWALLINYYSVENDTTGVLNAAWEAIEHFPENSEFYYTLGSVARLKKDTETTLWAWRKAVSLLKEKNKALSSMLQGQIGDLYMENKRKQEAYAAYDTALIYNENNLLVLNNYAYFLSLDGIELEKAERMSAKTIQVDSKSPVYLDTYAWVFFKQGYYMPALMYIEQAYVYGGNEDAEVLEHYGDILYKTGSEEKARKMWEAAWEIKKGDEQNNLILKKKIDTGIYVEE